MHPEGLSSKPKEIQDQEDRFLLMNRIRTELQDGIKHELSLQKQRQSSGAVREMIGSKGGKLQRFQEAHNALTQGDVKPLINMYEKNLDISRKFGLSGTEAQKAQAQQDIAELEERIRLLRLK